MKRVICCLLLFLSGLSMQAQLQAELNWGEEIRLEGRTEFITVLGFRDDKIYALGSSGSEPSLSLEVSLLIYNAQTLKNLSEFVLIDSKSDQNFEKAVLTDDELFVFTSFYDRKLGFKILTVAGFNEDDASWGEFTRIDEVFSSDKNDPHPFHIKTSPDQRNILVFHENSAVSGNKAFNMKVLDLQFVTLWEKEIELNYKEIMVNFQDFMISDDLTVYLLATLNPYGLKKSSAFGSILNLKNSLFIYRPYDDRLKEYEFALSRNWIGSVRLKMDEAQNVLASAYFTYPNDFKVRGFVLFKIDGRTSQTLMRKMITLSKTEFNAVDDAIGRLKDYSRMLIGSYGNYTGLSSHMNTTSTEFDLKYIFSEEGEIVLALEALRRDERCTESLNDQQMLVTCEKHFFYGDVLLFFLDSEGELSTVQTVRKIQHSRERLNPYFSFTGIEDNDRLYVFYNDDKRNLEDRSEPDEDGDKVPLARVSKARLNMESFGLKGNYLTTTLAQTGGESELFYPVQGKFIGDSALLLYSLKEKNYKFGKLLIR